MKLTDRILKEADGKRDLGKLAADLGTTERYVRSFLCRVRRYDLIPPPPVPIVERKPNCWLIPGVLEMLEDLHKQGIPNSAIAAALNAKFGTTFSKNAIVGQAKRRGMPVRRTRRVPPPKTKAQTDKTKIVRPPVAIFESEPLPVRKDLPPAVARKKLNDLLEWDCRWPVGDPQKPDFGFCAQERIPGKPYCAECCQRAFQTVKVPIRVPDKERETA